MKNLVCEFQIAVVFALCAVGQAHAQSWGGGFGGSGNTGSTVMSSLGTILGNSTKAGPEGTQILQVLGGAAGQGIEQRMDAEKAQRATTLQRQQAVELSAEEHAKLTNTAKVLHQAHPNIPEADIYKSLVHDASGAVDQQSQVSAFDRAGARFKKR